VSGSDLKGRKRKELACLFRTASVLKGRMWVVLRRLIMLKENVRDTGGELGQGIWAGGLEKTRVKEEMELTRPFWTSTQSVCVLWMGCTVKHFV
jgi:hypothetical protein